MRQTRQYFLGIIAFSMSKAFYSIRYFLLLIFLFTNLVSRAEFLIDSTTYLLRENDLRDSIKQIDGEDKRLQALSNAYDFLGNAESTYDAMDDQNHSELNDGEVWIHRFSADGKELLKPLNSYGQEINKELTYINEVLKLSPGRKKDCRVLVLAISGIPAKQETQFDNRTDLEKTLNNINVNTENVIKWNATRSKILGDVSKEQLKHGYTELIVYVYSEFHFYTGKDEKSLRKSVIPSLHFYGSTFEGQDALKNKIKSPLINHSNNKNEKSMMKGQIKAIINKVETEYLGLGARQSSEEEAMNSDSGNPLCKPLNELIKDTWTNAEKGSYDFAIFEAATLYKSPKQNQRISPKIIVDQPDKFDNSYPAQQMLGQDYQYLREILPDKLSVLKGNSNHDIEFLFTRVGFVIPKSERVKFARDVSVKIALSGNGKKILIVVPYYSCTERDDNFIESNGKPTGLALRTYPFLFMPAAVSDSDPELARKMNEAFESETGFEKAFEKAFIEVPKTHTVYIGKVCLNGTVILIDPVQEKGFVSNSSNFVDVKIVVDNRITLIEKGGYFRDCGLHPDIKCKDGGCYDQELYEQQYYKCRIENSIGMAKVLLANPVPVYNEFGSLLCNLKQSELVKEESGASLAFFYIDAAIGKYITHFLPDKTLFAVGNFEEKRMENKYFYSGKNEFYEGNPLFTAIDAASFLLGFVDLDFIPDAVGYLTAHILGDEDAVGEYRTNLIITGTVAGIIYKASKAGKAGKEIAIGVDGLKQAAKEGIIHNSGEMIGIAPDIFYFFRGATDFSPTVLKNMGFAPNVVEMAERDPALLQLLKDAFFEVKAAEGGGKNLVKKADFDKIYDKVQREQFLIPNFLAAQKKGPVTLGKFIEDMKAAPKFFMMGEKAKTFQNLKEDFPWVTVLLDDGVNLDAKEIAQKMIAGGYPQGKPIRVVYLGDPEKAQKISKELAIELNTKAKYCPTEIKISSTGDVLAKDGGIIPWKKGWREIDYRDVVTPKRMLSGPNEDLKFGGFVIALTEIDASGNVLCKVGDQTKWLTADEVADLAVKNGLRPDAEVFVVSTLGDFYESTQKNIKTFCDNLAGKLETRVNFGADRKLYYDAEAKAFGKINEVANAPGVPTMVMNYKWESTGSLKPFRSFTNAVHEVEGADNGVYIIVEEFSNGKVRISYAPLNKKDEWVDASQLLDQIKKADLLDGRPIHIVPKKGADNLDDAERFLANLSEKAKTEAKISTNAVDAASGETIKVVKLKYASHTPVGEGTHFLNTNVTNPEVLRFVKKYDNPKFVEQLGLALEQNNKKYLAKYTDFRNSNLIEKLYVDYTQYGKVSIPTFENLQSITKQLDIKFLDDVWVKDLWKKAYDKPAFAKNFDNQLKWLDPDDLEDLANPENFDLLTKAIASVEVHTAKGGGATLRYMMALEHLGEKLPKEMAKALEERFVKDPEFVDFLAGEITKLDAAGLDKFKRYHNAQPDDFLGEFNSLYKGQSRKVGLADYISLSQRKNQIVFAGANDNTLRTVADKLLPQEGYMDVFLRTDGENFIELLPNGTKKIITPEEVALQIRQNEHWDERPLRLIVRGDNMAADVKLPAQKLINEVDVQGSKINPKNDFVLTDDGKLINRWENLSPTGPGPIIKESRGFSDPRMMASLGKDAATVQAAARLKSSKDKFYVVVHGQVTTSADGTAMFWVLHNDEWKGIDHRSLTRWLETQPGFKEAKTIHLVSCGAASTELAQNFANKAKKEVLAAGGEIGVLKSGEVVALGGKADEWKLLKPANSSIPPPPSSAGSIRVAKSGEDALPLKYIETPTLKSIDEEIEAFKKANPDPWIEGMVDKAKQQKNDDLLKDIFGQRNIQKGVEIGASGNRYPAKLSNLKKTMDEGNPKYIAVSLADRPKYELKIKDGKLYNQGERLDEGQLYLYVMDGNGKMYVTPETPEIMGKFYHSSFLPGENLAASGTIKMDGGRIEITNHSGHFEPTGDNVLSAVHELTSRGVDIKSFGHMDILSPRIRDVADKALAPEIDNAFKVFESNPNNSYADFLNALETKQLERKYPNELAQKEEAMLRHFAAEGNHEVNDAIIKKAVTAGVDAQKTIVNNTLEKLPKYKGGLVYRGAGSIESMKNSSVFKGETISFDQFLYTSKERGKAMEYMKSGSDKGFVLYEILPKTAVDISDISVTSKYWEELISPTNTKYKVVADRIETKLADGSHLTIIQLEEL
jgi:hypothetical protein